MVQSVHSQCMNITLLGGHSNINWCKILRQVQQDVYNARKYNYGAKSILVHTSGAYFDVGVLAVQSL